GLTFAGFALLAMASLLWESVGRLGATRLLAPALLVAVIPAGHALTQAVRYVHRWLGLGGAIALPASLAILPWLAAPQALTEWLRHLQGPKPLLIGLNDERRQIVASILAHTQSDARILWEDRSSARVSSRWTPLLPLLTQRAFVGGLDPDAGIEHT